MRCVWTAVIAVVTTVVVMLTIATFVLIDVDISLQSSEACYEPSNRRFGSRIEIPC